MASESGHYIERCKHGKVLSQCRCPGPRTEYVIECNPDVCGVEMASDVLERAETFLRLAEWVSDARYADHVRLVGDLAAEVRELRKDRERLNKLWRNTGGVGTDDGEWTAMWTFPQCADPESGWPDDIRVAIDAMEDGPFADAAMEAER